MSTSIIRDKCVECDGPLTSRAIKHETKVGKVTVTDGSAMVPVCVNCGEPQLTLDDLGAYERRAVATVLREGHVDGAVLRFARRSMGLRQVDLASIIDVSSETVSRWETGALALGRAEQLALLALLDDVERGENPLELVKKKRPASEPPPSQLYVLARTKLAM